MATTAWDIVTYYIINHRDMTIEIHLKNINVIA